jgi:hypothetical protein
MINSYLIQWKSTVNGRAGRGSKVFEFEEASRLAAELNREYPGIHHEPVKATSAPETPGPPQVESSEAGLPEAGAEMSHVSLSPDFAMSA